MGMPQRENRQKQEREDIAHPVSGNFKRELETAILEEYHKKLENQRQRQENTRSRLNRNTYRFPRYLVVI